MTGNPSAVDLMRQTRQIQISPDGKYLGAMHDDNHISIVPLTNGIPDLGNLSTINQTPATGTGRSFAWDAADNIYTTSSGELLLRVWSVGFTTTAITGNDSTSTNGTFQLVTPATTASVTASTNVIFEADLAPAVFTITRTNANSDYSGPMTVNLTFSGTATLSGPAADYTVSPSSATSGFIVIAAG